MAESLRYPATMKSKHAPAYPEFAQRGKVLAAEQKLRMAGSVHAFVRGSTVRFYEWLEQSSAGKVPDGPPVWICGTAMSAILVR